MALYSSYHNVHATQNKNLDFGWCDQTNMDRRQRCRLSEPCYDSALLNESSNLLCDTGDSIVPAESTYTRTSDFMAYSFYGPYAWRPGFQ